ncbi:hypothetical protein ACQB6R_08565 [Propionibacteriaceae bacterium G1746]|uniref:hypothetical protein n=1 Tax=Aestuariimicrobium sp. G57 TaxID=3418485 RepID=UPI003C238146
MPDFQNNPFESFEKEARSVNKLPATEIRRLGDRRRTNRRVAIGSGVAAVVAVAVGAVSLFGGGPNTGLRPDIAGTPVHSTSTPDITTVPSTTSQPTTTGEPSPTAPVTSSAITTAPATTVTVPAGAQQPTWDNVPPVNLMFGNNPQLGKVFEQHEGFGQAALGFCDPGPDAKPATVLVRQYGYVSAEVDTPTKFAVVRGYTTTADADAAYAQLSAELANCAKRYETSDEFSRPGGSSRPLTGLPNSAVGTYYWMSMLINGTDDGWFNDALLIKSGNRILYVGMQVRGMDYNCATEPNPEIEMCDFPMKAADLAALLAE